MDLTVTQVIPMGVTLANVMAEYRNVKYANVLTMTNLKIPEFGLGIDVSNKFIYDIETYKSCFSFSAIREDGKFARSFEVSYRRNEIGKIFSYLDYIKDADGVMVGFNSLAFDYPILHKLLDLRDRKTLPSDGDAIAALVYGFAQEQIDGFKGGFPNTVRVFDRYIPQVDLFKIHHFDNQARMTSLKMLEFNMREDNIKDLPFPVGSALNGDEIDVLLKYNLHDVMMTLAFYKHSLPMIEFREKLTHTYGRDFINCSDAKIGGDYFCMRLEEAGIPLYTKNLEGKRLPIQTKRDEINIGECLFDYYDFKRPEFIALHNWFSKQAITETKGVFSDVPEHLLGDVAKYAEMRVKRKKFAAEPTTEELAIFKKEYPLGYIDKIELGIKKNLQDELIQGETDLFGAVPPKAKKTKIPKYSYWACWRIAETLNVVVDGFRLDFGTGGIHGSLSSKVVRETKKYKLVDADVSSMYPSLAIANNVYPEHLTEKFCSIYKDLYNQRKEYAKNTPENAMIKLSLNATYGNSNNKFSVFYDPMYTMRITINGELSICLLIERLLNIEGLLMVGANTDGVTVALPRGKQEEYDIVCKAWETQTGLQLEFVEYAKMFLRDVNSYTAVYKNGDLKCKGAYEYEGLQWHKNQSSLIIPMAAVTYMLHGTDIREFITGHKDKFDFMLRAKIPRNSRLILVMTDGTEIAQQNICRYYPCKSGGKLVKIMPALVEGGEDRRFAIDGDWNVKPCNDIKDFAGDIDYEYYISEAEKLVIK